MNLPVSDRQSVPGVDAMTAEFVVVRDGQNLQVRQSRTGTFVWSRSGVPENQYVLCDSQVVGLVDPRTGHETVYSLATGLPVTESRLAPVSSFAAVAGRDPVIWFDIDGKRVIRRVDLLTEQSVWENAFTSDDLLTAIDRRWIAALNKTGQFRLLDINTGHVQVDVTADPI